MVSPVKNWRDTKQLAKFLGKRAKLLVWTKVFTPALGFEHQVPYYVGIVEFQEGNRLSAQIVDCLEDQLQIGLEVITVLRRIGKVKANDVITYGIKVKPVKPATAV